MAASGAAGSSAPTPTAAVGSYAPTPTAAAADSSTTDLAGIDSVPVSGSSVPSTATTNQHITPQHTRLRAGVI